MNGQRIQAAVEPPADPSALELLASTVEPVSTAPKITPLPPVLADVPAEPEGTDEPPSSPLGRGLKAARRIEETAELVRLSRRHARAAAASDHRRRAIRQLKKLLAVLDRVQREVLASGVSKPAYRQLKVDLREADVDLHAFLERSPRRGALKLVRRVARSTRRTFQAHTS